MQIWIVGKQTSSITFEYKILPENEKKLIRKAIQDRIDLLTDSQSDTIAKEKEATKLEEILKYFRKE